MSKPDPALLRIVIELMCEAWPRCFSLKSHERKPLKTGIHSDMIAAVGGAVEAELLGAALRSYVGVSNYLHNLAAAHAMRVGLDGQPVSEVSQQDRQKARERLAARAKKAIISRVENRAPAQGARMCN